LQNTNEAPLVSAEQNWPEITIKALVLSVILVILLSATNAYLGLKIGVTISASIPAAVISMAALRFFKHSNVLENNIVQTAASAGESTVAGLAFILPAMIMIHYWTGFNYQQTFWSALIGGILGVLFSIPVRRILLFHKDLRFPEGTAIGHVLKAGAEKKGDLKYLIQGGIVGGLISFTQSGLQILSSSVLFWQRAGSFIYGAGLGFDPALLAAGYIVGPTVACATLLGIVIGWWIGIPILSHIYGIPSGNINDAAMSIWHDHIRYIGVGTMLTGGFWTLLVLIKPILQGIKTSFISIKTIKTTRFSSIPRTERDIPMNIVLWATVLLCIPLSILYYHYANNAVWNLSFYFKIMTVLVADVFTIVIGFIMAVIGAYFAGLIGSTNSPTSALSLATLMLMSLVLMALLGQHLQLSTHPEYRLIAIAFTIMVATVISAASISNETIQDLKAGHMLGATPWKQQVMLIIGVVISSLLAPLILQLLFEAYGIGGVFPRPNMNPANMLAAPQAGMLAALVQSTFSLDLPWSMLITGTIIGIICIMIDYQLRKSGKSLPVLAMGIGIYLPFDASAPFVIGGIACYFIGKAFNKRYPHKTENEIRSTKHRGITLACGIVAGAALMGVVLAIPFAIAQSTDVLKISNATLAHFSPILSLLMAAGIFIWMYKIVLK
jgi:putative OPT family oligopeptide transporter